ncbi:universal stress protein [Massilia cavernae]|uniref:Universal stress protein n=1 Tax=Massilia cavernae TaxID=2320864 RepID=A0A418XR21_9BURK|nr:universal stress protein [Massilia cavernae]RJG14955.1 universal stress protein [Massilia cavernae]
MSYKTILVHADSSRHADERIRVAARLAMAEGAHLVGAAMTGVSRYLYQESSIDLARTAVAMHMDALYQRATVSLERFEALAGEIGVPTCERRMVDDEPEGGLALQARYADVVVVSQTDPQDPAARITPALPEYVMLNSARPVLIVPYAGTFPRLGEQVLVGWDASAQATRAVTNAIPLLKRARNVTIAVFNPNPFDAHGEQPGADIALYLARHGVNIEVSLQQTGLDPGNAMLSMAADRQCDLVVMGGYGHTRFREMLLGGVTSTVLGSMTVPVLMSH